MGCPLLRGGQPPRNSKFLVAQEGIGIPCYSVLCHGLLAVTGLTRRCLMSLKIYRYYIRPLFRKKLKTVDRDGIRMEIYLRLNVSPIPVQIVEFRGATSSYAVLKKFHGLAW